ncbi:MAG: hypothetical protein B7Z80_02680 [Rhodospirillales bacterium 20-64-7]|nr:MAG: hypothetical protein B7Z80_02680 [Rhodospirillales bacterium 20-64-7]
MLQYDNIDDAQIKLLKTICLYDKKPVHVLGVDMADIHGKLPYKLTLKLPTGDYINCLLDDPKFSFRDYNLGYANQGAAPYWWFRRPLKQYRQGLRGDQMESRFSNPNLYGGARFEYSRGIIAMLENQYPHYEKCARPLVDGEAYGLAFHKDFALSYDRLHKDFIIEYRGKVIGQTKNFKDFTVLDEFKHLQEPLTEALG